MWLELTKEGGDKPDELVYVNMNNVAQFRASGGSHTMLTLVASTKEGGSLNVRVKARPDEVARLIGVTARIAPPPNEHERTRDRITSTSARL